jgi:hypothetical protein
MLHILNGDATAARLAPAALPGEVLVWRDILVEGPVARELGVDALAERRAPWLERHLGIAPGDYIANGRTQADGLARASTHDEIVLWFEQDLFCVANLGHLAAWLRRARPPARVSLVFPAEPLGTTESAALAALFAERRPFTDDAIAHAAAWWAAYTAPDPSAFAPREDALPFLDVAARLHLARFPAIGTGLGAVEAAALAALDKTPRPFADVFRAATRDERMRGHGMADLQFFAYLHALADGPAPLVTIEARTAAITAAGRAVREGARDRLDAQALDWWLGGVHLEGRHAAWRWDPVEARVVAA